MSACKTAPELLWQTKLAARLHDPAEKALVLLRDPAGHEGGSIVGIGAAIGFEKRWVSHPDGTKTEKLKLPSTMAGHVHQGDIWAAAADRPNWPRKTRTKKNEAGVDVPMLNELGEPFHDDHPWAQVRWTDEPKLVHPLTGALFDLKSLCETEIDAVKDVSYQHFHKLLSELNEQGNNDHRKTLLAYWRFGPELRGEEADNGVLGALWPLLPADTRIPDHSIWDHLDLTSAFAGAFAGDPDGNAALLTMSIGPVQSFIAAARSTSDLWAGSHLLSRLSWQAMRVVCEQLGPDAILFPRLRGVPQVDLWLRDEMKLPPAWFEGSAWTTTGTDANPLFTAALPNRFVAVVPASQGKAIAEAVTTAVREWLHGQGKIVMDRLLKEASEPEGQAHCHQQMREQLAGFPEVHWAAVPFSLIRPKDADRQRDLDVTALSSAMAPFFGAKDGAACGFLDTPAWQVLQKEMQWDDKTTEQPIFWSPNPGALYSAVYDLAERVLAAAKAVRPFAQTQQHGWRCSLTGETEWLTTDPEKLKKTYRNQPDTLWAKIAKAKPSWAKKGEHLGALPAIKRLWPTLFAEEVSNALGETEGQVPRFVVSTHTMALAGHLEKLDSALAQKPAERQTIDGLLHSDDRAPALPRKLAKLRGSVASRIPAALDRLADTEGAEAENALNQLEHAVKDALGHKPETYYGLIMLDGDHMGRILSGDETNAISYADSFHPKVRDGFNKAAEKQQKLIDYGKQKRALSPNRHLAISASLNDFSLTVVPHIIEIEFAGKLIYAGGDDVLAMVPASELLECMRRLRMAYSGTADEAQTGPDMNWRDALSADTLVLNNGYALLPPRGKRPFQLMRMMGHIATASCGGVIAHHQAPLAMVLRELKAAEQRAKDEGGRDAFSLTLMKRSGGTTYYTAKWGVALDLLQDLRAFLADPSVSRRAVYNTLAWLKDLPDQVDRDMLTAMLGYQLARQTNRKTALDYHDVPGLTRQIANLACDHANAAAKVAAKSALKAPLKTGGWKIELRDFMTHAEFLAREAREGDAVVEQSSPRSNPTPILAEAAMVSGEARQTNRRRDRSTPAHGARR